MSESSASTMRFCLTSPSEPRSSTPPSSLATRRAGWCWRTWEADTFGLTVLRIGGRCCTLGSLHGEATLLVEQQLTPGHPLTRFDAGRGEYREWMDLLTQAAACPCSGVREWVPALLAQLLPRLAADTAALLHGDLDLSNAIPTDAGMALVDWEKASIGPVSLDLGFLIEFIRRPEEIDSYRLAFCDASGRGVAPERLGELIDLADGYDSLRWICHYLREVAAGRDPGPDWRDADYVPRLDRLHSLRGRRQEWFLSSY